MRDKILNFSFFFFAFLMPFQGIPKVNLGGIEVRPGVFFALPIWGHILFNFKKFSKSIRSLFSLSSTRSILIFSILTFVITFINQIDTRSIGFLFWLVLSVSLHFYAGIIKNDWIIKGLLFGQIFNLFYIPLMFFKGEEIITYAGKIRAYGLMGEPSYLAIALVPLLIFVNQLKDKKLLLGLKLLIYFGLLFSFSRTALIGVLFVLIVELILYRKNYFLFSLSPFILILIFSLTYNPHFYGIRLEPVKLNEKNEKIKVVQKKKIPPHLRGYEEGTPPILAGSTKQRLLSLERGLILFKERPFGVGLGNSHRELKKRFVEYTYWRNFPKNERWKARIDGLHNLFLEVAVETGVFGLLAFLMFLFFMAKDLFLFKLYNELAMFLGMLLTMQFAQNVNMPTMWIILSHCLVQIQKKVSVES